MKNEIVYFDNDNHIVDEEKATKAIIRELDENGNLVRETFGTIDNTPTEISDEEFDALMEQIKERRAK